MQVAHLSTNNEGLEFNSGKNLVHMLVTTVNDYAGFLE